MSELVRAGHRYLPIFFLLLTILDSAKVLGVTTLSERQQIVLETYRSGKSAHELEGQLGRFHESDLPESIVNENPDWAREFLDIRSFQIAQEVWREQSTDLVLASNYASTAVKIDPRPYIPAREYLSLESALEEVEGVAPEDSPQFASEIVQLATELRAHAAKEFQRLGRDEFEKLASEGKIKFNNENGLAELNLVDGEIFYRVIHKDSEISIPFHWNNKTKSGSLHNHQILANQHLIAGKSRKDGKTGRDVLETWISEDGDGSIRITRVKFFPRYDPWTKEWWRDQYLATANWPNFQSFAFSGLLWGLIQYEWVTQIAKINHEAFNAHPPTQGQALFIFFFGTLCGTFSTFLRKFNQIGSDREMIIRNIISTSLPFYIPFVMLDPSKGPAYFLQWTTYVWMALFFVMNNSTKIEIQKIVRAWTDKRLTNGTILKVKKQDWIYQSLINFVQMPLRLGDLMDFLKVNINWLHATVPGGKILFFGAYVPMKFVGLKNKELINADDARKERIQWEKSLYGLLFGLPIESTLDFFRFNKKGLSRINDRWKRQRLAPAYHLGRFSEWLSGAVSPAVEIEKPKIRNLKFKRVKPGWEQNYPPKPGLISRVWTKVASAATRSARSMKEFVNLSTYGGLSKCSAGLASLSQKMKAPFKKKIEELEIQ